MFSGLLVSEVSMFSTLSIHKKAPEELPKRYQANFIREYYCNNDIFLDDHYSLALILKKVGLTFSSLNCNTLQKATGNGFFV